MSSEPYRSAGPGAGRSAAGRSRLPTRLAAVPVVLGVVGILSAFFVVGGLLGLVLGMLTALFVAAGVLGLVLGFSALGGSDRGVVAGRRMAIGAILAGAAALVLALLLTLLVALPVGAFFTRYGVELSDLDRCVRDAKDDRTRVLACQDDFARKVQP